MEEWKMIQGASHYFVSSEGKVMSTERDPKGVMIHGSNNGHGYFKVKVRFDDGSKAYRYIHRLVATAFVENKENKPCVNHIDNDPTNNRASNLEWCTHQENMDWSNSQGRNIRTQTWIARLRESLEVMEKPVIGTEMSTGKEIRLRSVNSSKEKGFQPSCVSQCCNGIRESHHGYRWRFAE